MFFQSGIAQKSKPEFKNFWAVNTSIDFNRHSSFGIGASIIFDDTSRYFGLDKGHDGPPVFSTFILTYKHNFWFTKFDNNPVNAHQFVIEYHNWDLSKCNFLGDIPKTIKLNYINIMSNGQTESILAPEIGLSLLVFQLTYRHNIFLNSNSKFENFLGKNTFSINFILPITRKIFN